MARFIKSQSKAGRPAKATPSIPNCTVCGKVFHDQRGIHLHMRSHGIWKPKPKSTTTRADDEKLKASRRRDNAMPSSARKRQAVNYTDNSDDDETKVSHKKGKGRSKGTRDRKGVNYTDDSGEEEFQRDDTDNDESELSRNQGAKSKRESIPNCTVCGKVFHDQRGIHLHMRSHGIWRKKPKPKSPATTGGKEVNHIDDSSDEESNVPREKGKAKSTKARREGKVVDYTDDSDYSDEERKKAKGGRKGKATGPAKVSTTPVSCVVCGLMFKDMRGIHLHMRSHNKSKKKARASTTSTDAPTCSVCGMAFKDRRGIHLHMRSHGIAGRIAEANSKRDDEVDDDDTDVEQDEQDGMPNPEVTASAGAISPEEERASETTPCTVDVDRCDS